MLKVSEVCTSQLLLSEDRAPTMLSGGALIGWLTANMLPCEFMVTKRNRLKHHKTHGASECCFAARILKKNLCRLYKH